MPWCFDMFLGARIMRYSPTVQHFITRQPIAVWQPLTSSTTETDIWRAHEYEFSDVRARAYCIGSQITIFVYDRLSKNDIICRIFVWGGTTRPMSPGTVSGISWSRPHSQHQFIAHKKIYQKFGGAWPPWLRHCIICWATPSYEWVHTLTGGRASCACSCAYIIEKAAIYRSVDASPRSREFYVIK